MSRFARRIQQIPSVAANGPYTITHGSQIPAAYAAGYIGLKAGVALTNVGTGWSPQANTSYQNLLIPRAHTITVPGVTFTNCHFVNTDAYRVLENWQAVSAASVTRLINCLIDGGGGADAGIFGQNFYLERCTFVNNLKDMHITDNVVAIECYMYNHVTPPVGAHCECALSNGGADRTFQRCYMTYEPNDGVSSAISMYGPDCNGFLLEDCYVSGGGYAVYGGDNAGQTFNVKIRGNIFGREKGRYSGSYGPMEFSGMNTPGWEYSNNVWGAFGPSSQAGDPVPGSPVATW